MQIDEAIELLEKANEGTTLLPDKAYYRINPDKFNQAIAKLREIQKPTDFTELWGRKLENAGALFKMGKSPDDWFQSIVTGFREALDIIEQQAKDR